MSCTLWRNSALGMVVSPLFRASSKASYTKIYWSCRRDEQVIEDYVNEWLAYHTLYHVHSLHSELLNTGEDIHLFLSFCLFQEVIQCNEGSSSTNTSTKEAIVLILSLLFGDISPAVHDHWTNCFRIKASNLMKKGKQWECVLWGPLIRP